jgi:hypothetical protein
MASTMRRELLFQPELSGLMPAGRWRSGSMDIITAGREFFRRYYT